MEFLGGEKQCQERKRFAPEVSETSPEIPYLGAFLERWRWEGQSGWEQRKEVVSARSSTSHRLAIATVTVRPFRLGRGLQAPPPSSASVRVAASRPQGKLGTELPRTQTAFSSEAPDFPKCHLISAASPNPRRDYPLNGDLLAPSSQWPVSNRLFRCPISQNI